VRPNLYVVAELYSKTEVMEKSENYFVNRLGINAIIKGADSCFMHIPDISIILIFLLVPVCKYRLGRKNIIFTFLFVYVHTEGTLLARNTVVPYRPLHMCHVFETKVLKLYKIAIQQQNSMSLC